MSATTNLKKMFAAAAVALGLLASAAGPASAAVQGNYIGTNGWVQVEATVAGDFDSDGRDDLAIYSTTSIEIRLDGRTGR